MEISADKKTPPRGDAAPGWRRRAFYTLVRIQRQHHLK